MDNKWSEDLDQWTFPNFFCPILVSPVQTFPAIWDEAWHLKLVSHMYE
jgi:hypothetical protein